MSPDELLGRIAVLPLFIISLTVHEWAHAWSAWKLGDDTASLQGRLTLNPIAHVDLLGTIILPLLGVPFGWAKPVPVNPARFRREVSMSGGMALTAGAGPLSNLVLALLSTVAIGLLIRWAPALVEGPVFPLLRELVVLNVALAIFNLLPVPPLDGSRVVAWLMPRGLAEGWRRIELYAPVLLIAVFLWGGRLVAGPISAVYRQLEKLIYLIA
ncbi:MAG: site-2 protease family protein [Anaeromyxobacter sp.]